MSKTTLFALLFFACNLVPISYTLGAAATAKEDLTCSICTESLTLQGKHFVENVGDAVINLQCHPNAPHRFHIECIGQWSHQNNGPLQCPTCRKHTPIPRNFKLDSLYKAGNWSKKTKDWSDKEIFDKTRYNPTMGLTLHLDRFRQKQLRGISARLKQEKKAHANTRSNIDEALDLIKRMNQINDQQKQELKMQKWTNKKLKLTVGALAATTAGLGIYALLQGSKNRPQGEARVYGGLLQKSC